MKVFQVIKYLWPIINLLITLFKPKLLGILEKIHDCIDHYADEKFPNLAKPESTEKKIQLFDEQAEEICTEHKVTLDESDLNLIREVVHKKCEIKAAKEAKKEAKKNAKKK